VHSFANDPSRGIFIIFLLLTIGGSGFLIFFIQSLKIKTPKNYFSLCSKSGLVLINNFLLCLALFVVVLGTLYPLILQSLFDTSISVGPFYYQKILSPLAIVILFLIIFAPYLKLTDYIFSYKIIRRSAFVIAASALLTEWIFIKGAEIKFLPLTAIFLSAAIIFSVLFYFYQSLSNKKITLNYLSMMLGHIGVAIVIIGISASSLLSKSKELNMKLQDVTSIAGQEIKFKNLDYYAGKNYLARVGIFEITKKNEVYFLKPETRYYPVSEQSTTEAAIKHKILADLYLVIGNKDENDNFAVRIYYKPFISFIWLGCLILFVSGLLSLLKNRINKALKINYDLV
jgi:cytochrome c-type biogenesis protein CcmF